MKFKIVAKDKNRGTIEIPVSFGELASLYDLSYMLCSECWDTLKLNKLDKDFSKLVNKAEYIIDIKYDGKCYHFEKNKKGKYIRKTSKTKYFLYKKPKWKK